MSTQGFYADLAVLNDLLDLANPACYTQAPDDWYVLVADIVESAEAIADGKYREINLMSASAIMAVLNQLHPLAVPFIFRGDGASVMVPPNYLQMAQTALLGVRSVARCEFGLELRVGVVPLATINQHHPLKVAKFRLAPHCCQANFIGGGLTFAAELVKQEAAYQLNVDGHPDNANLTGLECRWQEVPSSYDHTLSLIVAALSSSGCESSAIYRNVFQAINTVFGEPENYHPIHEEALQLSFNFRQLMTEARLRSLSPSAFARLRWVVQIVLENLLESIFMQFGLTIRRGNGKNYKKEVRAASDFKKMDDVLRMVISGSSSQTQQLIQYLENESQAGRLAYGLHVSDRALLTCLILDRRNHHYHLVDGADGGYTLAAKDLKGQLHQKVHNWKTFAKIARQRK